MTEADKHKNNPHEGSREAKWEKTKRLIDVSRKVIEITPETDPDDAMQRILLQEREMLRKNEPKVLRLARNQSLRNAGFGSRPWHLYFLSYALPPTEIDQPDLTPKEIVETSIRSKLPEGIDVFVQQQLCVNSDYDIACTGEIIGTDARYWEVYARKTLSQHS